MSESLGVESYIIDTVSELNFSWIEGKKNLGITSGASVPKKIVDDLITVILKKCPDVKIHEEESIEKDIKFPLPNL